MLRLSKTALSQNGGVWQDILYKIRIQDEIHQHQHQMQGEAGITRLTNLEAEVRAFRASRSIFSNFIKTINFSTDYYIFSIHEFIYRIIETYFK